MLLFLVFGRFLHSFKNKIKYWKYLCSDIKDTNCILNLRSKLSLKFSLCDFFLKLLTYC